MRNLKAVMLMSLAILVGLGAALFAAGWVADSSRLAATKVVVAAADIALGSKLQPQMLNVVDWPSGSVPPGAFTDLRQLQERVVRNGLGRGEPVLERNLMPQGAQGGLSAVIAEGKRAMTVRVNDVVGVAGFALPGTYVDVMVNAQQERGKGEAPMPVSMTVLENVLVLAVAQESGRDETKPKVVNAVTLELSPADAEKLDLARSVGTLSLVLRNQLDKNVAAGTGISKQQLFRIKEEIVPAKAEPAPKPVVAARKPMPLAVAVPARVAAPAQDCVEIVRNATRALSCF